MKKYILLILLFPILCFSYDRSDWKHWIDEDKDCQNTRAEILIERSLSKIEYSSNKCTVKSGSWTDFYTGETLFNASDIDIDHVVPLKHADELVGNIWTRDQKKKFANDPMNLIITYKKFNRQKGAKTISEWLPSNKTNACRYIKRWMLVKQKYNLPISIDEKKSQKFLKDCN